METIDIDRIIKITKSYMSCFDVQSEEWKLCNKAVRKYRLSIRRPDLREQIIKEYVDAAPYKHPALPNFLRVAFFGEPEKKFAVRYRDVIASDVPVI
jgi:hypothetical protein